MRSGAGNLEPESGNLLMAEITITPRARGIGAEVGGIDLGKPLPDKSFEAAIAFERIAFLSSAITGPLTSRSHTAKSSARWRIFPIRRIKRKPQDRAPRHQYRPRDEHHKTGRRSWTQIIHPRNIGVAYRFFVSHPAVQGIGAVRSGNAGGRRRHDVRGYNPGLRFPVRRPETRTGKSRNRPDFEETQRRHKAATGHLRCKPQPRQRGSRLSPSALTDAAPCSSAPTRRVSRA